MNEAKKKLMEILQSIGQQLYQDVADSEEGAAEEATATEAGAPGEDSDEANGPDSSEDEDVVEADFEVVDEEKKD